MLIEVECATSISVRHHYFAFSQASDRQTNDLVLIERQTETASEEKEKWILYVAADSASSSALRLMQHNCQFAAKHNREREIYILVYIYR